MHAPASDRIPVGVNDDRIRQRQMNEAREHKISWHLVGDTVGGGSKPLEFGEVARAELPRPGCQRLVSNVL